MTLTETDKLIGRFMLSQYRFTGDYIKYSYIVEWAEDIHNLTSQDVDTAILALAEELPLLTKEVEGETAYGFAY